MKVIAIIFPCFAFFLRGKYFNGIICLVLQIFVVGWIPAAIWAYMDLDND